MRNYIGKKISVKQLRENIDDNYRISYSSIEKFAERLEDITSKVSTPDKLHVYMSVSSEPTEATFTMSALDTVHTLTTDEERSVPRGLYNYMLEKSNYLPVKGVIDLVDLKGDVNCKLYEEQSAKGPSYCRID